MRKIKTTNITEQHGLTALNVDWGEVYLFKNKDKAKRTATRLNKYYTEQLQRLNFLYIEAFRLYRTYWLFLKPYDAEQIQQRLNYVHDSLEHALTYQTEFFNTPAAISRTIADLNSVCDSLLLYATRRKDIPLQHEIKILKTRIQDDYERKPGRVKGQDQLKRPAFRKAAG